MSLALSGWVSQRLVSRPSDQDVVEKKRPIPLLAGDGFLAIPRIGWLNKMITKSNEDVNR